MYTELLIAIPIYFIIINIAIITELIIIRRKQCNCTAIELYHVKTSLQPQFTLLDDVLIAPIPKQPLLLTAMIPAYSEADVFIKHQNHLYTTVKNKIIESGIIVFNYDHLFEYLSIHFAKYPDGKLPAQPGTITYYDNKLQATMNFYDASDTRCEKYIKPAMKLLKEKKVKQLNILTEAEKIVKSKRIPAKGRTVKLKVFKVTDNKLLVEA
jgi:hypothetical protein